MGLDALNCCMDRGYGRRSLRPGRNVPENLLPNIAKIPRSAESNTACPHRNPIEGTLVALIIPFAGSWNMRRLPLISLGLILLCSSALASSPNEEESASIAVLVRHEPGGGDLADMLQPLLEAETARQWLGHLVERAELEKVLAELGMAGKGDGAEDDADVAGRLQLGKLSHADCLLTVRAGAASVQATLTRFPSTAVVHEQIYDERLQPDSLALRIVTDAMKALRQRDRDPLRPYVSLGSFYYADPHRRFFQLGRDVRTQLRQTLSENRNLLLTERTFPSQLLSEFELAREGLTDHVARNLSAPPADVLLYGEFQPQPDQDLNSQAAVLDHTLVVLSPTGLCEKRQAKFTCRSNEPETIATHATRLIEQAVAEVRNRLAAGQQRSFSEQEFESFKQQAFRLMPAPPMENGVFYQEGGYRGPTQWGKPEDLQLALSMLECAMLFRGDDTQVLVCAGAILDGMARHREYQGLIDDELLDAGYELIERAYRLESNWNTRGMYCRFCMSSNRSPAQRPSWALDAARQIWSTRQTEAWQPSQTDSAFATLFAHQKDVHQQGTMFLQVAPEFEAKEHGLRNLAWLFQTFLERIFRSDGDAESLQTIRRLAQRLTAERSTLMQAYGHLLLMDVYRNRGQTDREVGVPSEYAEHFQVAFDFLPELYEKYGKEFSETGYADRLRSHLFTYEKVTKQYGLDEDAASYMERYVDLQIRTGNHNNVALASVFETLLPRMWKNGEYDRAYDLITEFLKHNTMGGAGDFDRMRMARQRHRFARALGAALPLGMDRLAKIEFDDGRENWVTRIVAGENAVFGIRDNRWTREGQVFRTAVGSLQANIVNQFTGHVRDLAYADGVIGVGSESDGFYLLDARSLETRHLTPENSTLPGSAVTLVCDQGKDFFIAIPDKENLFTLVYRLEAEASKISHTDTKFVPHAYWKMKADARTADRSAVVPQNWQRRTAVADGRTLEFSSRDEGGAIKRITVTDEDGAQLLQYEGFELSFVFDWVSWQGQLLFATGNGLYVSEPHSNEVRCLLSEPDQLFLSLCPLGDRMYIGTSKGLYAMDAALLAEMLQVK